MPDNAASFANTTAMQPFSTVLMVRACVVVAALVLLMTACRSQPVTGHRLIPRPASTPEPAYKWRGIMVDAARYFVSVHTLRRVIDLAAHEQLNIVHLHVTDNEAWRLPSAHYPLLPSSRHYTANDIQDLVTYALARHVTIVPEIDMPAHNAFAIHAYPELACGQADVLCADTANRFSDSVVNEALQLFPGPYFHAGGDEVHGWSKQQRAQFEYHLHRILSRAHRTMVVWDDQADASPRDTLVEAWHLRAAASADVAGHRAIDASDGPFYFDAVQGAARQEPRGTRYMSTLEEVYTADPPPAAFGVEAVMWTEHVRDDAQFWYMLLPRALAFAQVARVRPEHKSWVGFREHVLPNELAWLRGHAYGFRLPLPIISVRDPETRYRSVPGDPDAAFAYTKGARVGIAITTSLRGADILYRLDDSHAWVHYTQSLNITTNGTRISARTRLPDGRTSVISSLYLRRYAQPKGSVQFDDIVSP